MRTLIVAVALSVFAVSLQAQELTKADYAPIATAIAGQMADYITSVRFSVNGSGCQEANPIFSRQTDGSFRSGKALIGKATAIGTTTIAVWITSKTHSRFMKNISRGMAYYAGGVGANSAVHNIAHCGW